MKPHQRGMYQSLALWVTLLSFLTPPLWARNLSSIVICAETGKIYNATNADDLIPPASLTKMMTLYLTFKALRSGKLGLDHKMPISLHATKQQPCKLGLCKGTCLTVRQAILGLVTKSANDAAVVLAETLGNGCEKTFAKIMTLQAQKLGMKQTIFKNASGLPHKQQITTARDMAILSRALYQDFPEYFKFFGTKKFAYKGTVHKNHNKLLGKLEGIDGIKTGFTCASGYNLAASMIRNNQRIIAVVLGGESIQDRDKKMTCLLEATFAKLQGKTIQGTSIADLITKCSMSPSKKAKKSRQAKREKAVQTASRKKKTKLASGKKKSHLASRKKNKKITKATLTSLDDIFDQLAEPSTPKHKQAPHARIR